MKDRVYLTGLILIGLTFIACVISYYLAFFGIFIFALGVLFIWLSKKTIKTKLIATVLPIILYLPMSYIFLVSYNHTSPKIFLIPADYEGIIRIVYEEKCGLIPTKENGKQIYQFPKNGILVLDKKFDGGINNEYFLVDSTGQRTKITETLEFKDKTKTRPIIQVGGSGVLGGDEKNKGITYTEFYLYNNDTSSIESYKYSEKFDSITAVIIGVCRTKK